jgi:hypothetical protein
VLAAHHPSVITEVHHLEAFGGSEGELRAFMAQFGYSARELQGEFSRDLLFQIEGLTQDYGIAPIT